MNAPITLDISKIRIDGGTQQRPLDDEAVTEYAGWLKEGRTPPPIQVVFDGKDYWLWDGFHRYHSARRVGRDQIEAVASKGDKRAAIWLSFGANKDHGVRRQKGVVKEILERIFADPEWAETPQAKIAEHVGATRQYVNSIKGASCQQLTRCASEPKQVTRGGKSYPMNTANIGRPRSQPDDDAVAEAFGNAPAPKLAAGIMEAGPVQGVEEPTDAPANGRDETGRDIPTEAIAAIFRRRGEITELMQAVTSLKSRVTKAAASDPLFRLVAAQPFAIDCNNLFSALKHALPYAVCPYCGGESIGNRCNGCKGSGWVNKVTFDNAPKELKELVA